MHVIQKSCIKNICAFWAIQLVFIQLVFVFSGVCFFCDACAPMPSFFICIRINNTYSAQNCCPVQERAKIYI